MKASALRDANQRGAQKGVTVDVDFLAPGELDFQLLGQYSRGGKTADKLLTGLAAAVDTALIAEDGRSYFPVALGNPPATVNFRN